jgi:acetyl-CoA carboxylase carboxyl transferase subunit alpha
MTDPSQDARLLEIEQQIETLEKTAGSDPAVRDELQRLREEVDALRNERVTSGSAWERVLLARHPQRPYFLDFARELLTDFYELHGDRRFADDQAVVGGMALFRGREVMAIGQQRGRDIREKIRRNFGMPKPEAYRKALRLMRMAEKFGRPVLTFIDTTGAYPGIDAEERGQAEAIAYSLRECARLGVPVICTVTGEGGSGGALGMAVANRILMLENAIFSVISPEGCASIMWRDASKKQLAAAALKLTAPELLQLGLIDEVIAEPPGGAQNDHAAAARLLGDRLEAVLNELTRLNGDQLRDQRYSRFRAMGQFFSE